MVAKVTKVTDQFEVTPAARISAQRDVLWDVNAWTNGRFVIQSSSLSSIYSADHLSMNLLKKAKICDIRGKMELCMCALWQCDG